MSSDNPAREADGQADRDLIERLSGLITEDDIANGPANPEGAVEAVLYDTFAWFRARAEAAEAALADEEGE